MPATIVQNARFFQNVPNLIGPKSWRNLEQFRPVEKRAWSTTPIFWRKILIYRLDILEFRVICPVKKWKHSVKSSRNCRWHLFCGHPILLPQLCRNIGLHHEEKWDNTNIARVVDECHIVLYITRRSRVIYNVLSPFLSDVNILCNDSIYNT